MFTEELAKKAREEDDLSPYSAEWRDTHGFPHGTQLVTMTQAEYGLLKSKANSSDYAYNQIRTMGDWLHRRFVAELARAEWPWTVKQADPATAGPTVVEITIAVLEEWDRKQKEAIAASAPKPGVFRRVLSALFGFDVALAAKDLRQEKHTNGN